ncbi:MAG: DNA-directed RNA polymerase subunit beta', partial [Patescibacteria group bacterium]|nr:DNA-directed RNA polymerase subunit beta' [Patescibacteria group bacterium]
GFNFNKADSDELGIDFYQRITNRTVTESIIDPKTKEKIIGKNQEITAEIAEKLRNAKIENVLVRSAINCQTKNGVCQKCYGKDLGTGKLVNMGEAVGVMAAQAIGEPGTQLTLKTFHMGGVTGEDITTGLPRVEELFEARRPRTPAIISEIAGTANIKTEKDQRVIDINSDEILAETHPLPEGYKLAVKNGEVIKAKQALATATDKKAIRASFGGKVKVEKNQIIVKSLDKISKQYIVSLKQTLKIKNGEKVAMGQQITEGHLDLGLALKLTDKQRVQHYIIGSIQEIYNSQGQVINDKHLEIILRQMFCKVYVNDGGDSEFISGQIINATEALSTNAKLKQEHKKPIISENIIMGVTRVALKTESFLSAASFQETTSILIDAAIKGKTDYLSGLKENVIIGKLIPAGTNYIQGK